jgi:4-oxalocrotonate tautomerase
MAVLPYPISPAPGAFRGKTKEEKMPVIHVHLYEGRTLEQKRKLVLAMTEAVVKSVDVKPEAVHILLHDIPKNNSAVGGVLRSDKKD